MINVILAESRKLRRPTLILSTLAVVTALSGLFTSIVFLNVNSGHNAKRGESITAHQLSEATGMIYGFKLVGFLLGIVALCIFASQTAQEYTHGTLRNLLVRQPARMKILAGKFVAMSIFAAIMVLFAAVITISLSYFLASGAKVETSSWSIGSHIFFQAAINIYFSTILYGTLGMILGLLLRSPISAISVGVIWSLILETILSASLPKSAKWLPGQNISNIADGGGVDLSYRHSVLLSLIYLGVAGAIASLLFKRRDVAN